MDQQSQLVGWVKFYPVCVRRDSEKKTFLMGQRKKVGYLRFLNSCIPSIVVTYWNPASTSLVASLGLLRTWHEH